MVVCICLNHDNDVTKINLKEIAIPHFQNFKSSNEMVVIFYSSPVLL